MRIGVSIILLDGYCYQSYNWNYMRPLGKLQTAIDSLEEYQCDEIAIIRPIRDMDTKESLQKDINEIDNIKCMTPISFGGGLRTITDIDLLHDLPIERLIFSSSFLNKDIELIQYVISLYGHQAIQCMLPFIIKEEQIFVFSSLDNDLIPLEEIDIEFINKYANEVILIDIENEGMNNKFNHKILKKINICNNKLIITGGIGKKTIKLAQDNNIASVIIDNKVLHNECSIKGYKNA